MSFKIGEIVELSIQSLAHGGAGVGRLSDFVFFIPLTAPGDKVSAQITSIKKNYAEAELKKIHFASQNRVDAPCEVYGQCGGCQWQHVNYQTQLEQKQKTVEHALSRIAKENSFTLKKIIPSPLEFNYRNRAQIRTQGPRTGFYSRGSHNLIEINKCLLLEEPLNLEIQKIKSEIKNFADYKTSKKEVFISQKGEVVRSENQAHGQEFGFSQVNTKQNQILQNLVLELLGNPSAEFKNILELFCGNGNFTLPLAKNGWDVYAVDSSKSAIHQARSMATDKTFFSCADCSLELKKLILKNRTFDCVLLDPPRTGCDEALIKNLHKTGMKKLIYVSCNPATFARDWARIKAYSNLKLEFIQPLDMFPQTYHVELLAYATAL